ncbi:MAG: DUF2147 domain-containing protein [Sphingomonas sp.]|uniref:DUF2147 domain-containing protein n=1 Tax=Sphingomonas sp. TaxID=28214 RepID=UPI001B018A65|nr:DUF2147 domain-containing protein [Sphingomonas sp.]MBO9621898.1 DUF2147 domain-containing protein [Sphingomonas sp.]
MKSVLSRLTAVALLAAPLAVPAAANETAPPPIASEWANPSNSVHVRIDRCGSSICGTVSWASAKAIADARRGGTQNLIGTRLFRDLEPAGAGKWKGKVFVPDIRKTFSGTISFSGQDKMVGKGCVLFGVICKAQTWSRVR